LDLIVGVDFSEVEGGHHESKTGTKDRVGAGGIVVYGGSCSADNVFLARALGAHVNVTLGIFLLLAVRDPAANRSLIAFGGWANLAHAGVMVAQEYRAAQKTLQLASRASGEPGDDGSSGRAGHFLATSLRLGSTGRAALGSARAFLFHRGTKHLVMVLETLLVAGRRQDNRLEKIQKPG
jgi:hypothetical protein